MQENAISDLITVIERLEATPPIPQEEAYRRMRQHHKEACRRMLEEGLSWADTTGDLLHFNRPDVVAYLKSIQSDLTSQTAIFSQCVEAWFDHCSHPAPGYTWRITVILRKAKLYDLEKRFLKAYFKHFHTVRGSASDLDLGIRAVKIGLLIPSIPDSSPLPLP